MELKNKRVLVVGLGRSGVAAATFLQEQGARVIVSDTKTEAQLQNEISLLLDRGISIETGRHGERTFRDQDLIVVSPGVPSDQPQLQQARSLGIPVIGEVELACRFLKGKIIAISGSNGKTTTTTLAGEILAKSGKKTLVGGNIGTPVISLAAQSSADSFDVLEISSFQLETIQQFRPHIAAILNITPDHLDRHRTFQAYVNAKARIFENQQPGDFGLLNADDPTCVGLKGKVKGALYWFSRKQPVENGTSVVNDKIIFRANGQETAVLPLSDIHLKGTHNLENVLAAVCIGMVSGCEAQQVRKAVAEFQGVEHRLELAANIHGVAFYNDSKATNVDATIKALESFPGNIHIILGGKDKGSDYTLLNSLLRERTKRAYLIGAAAEKIGAQIQGATPIVYSNTLERAVNQAFDSAVSGDVVLLAPACASFDQFENYEQRGRVFKDLVAALAVKAKQPVALGDRR
ncbi:MAG TPA: UDP-N-acetylmuramoyl-L-alanine--D-glutamate ligase [Candidatus Solibacter sp.]|jgi:UDP-N-acetylmuramoylalanine--D-glutamate ligase|nr:UDP-N-acetylmuramoyl-L-alanine--D-glutamate ligase [Candidatus Solibacter sp.]